jgi:hypothetical protein
MPYSSELYLDIFDKAYEDSREEKFESLRTKNIFTYRVKTIKSGNMLECEIYPIWKRKSEVSRAKKEMSTRKAQKNLNDKNAKKNIIRLMNANFNERDLAMVLSYKGKPPDENQARKDIQNYIRRIRDYRKKHGLSDLKYIYVIEFETEGNNKKRIHHHLIMNDMDRDIAEKLWNSGYANSKRLQPNEFGLEGIARYICKDPKGSKRWCASRNLDEPKVTIADHKITRNQAAKIARNQNEAHLIFQKIYKGYIFNDLSVKFNDFVSGAYLYARMRMDETKPKVKTKKRE